MTIGSNDCEAWKGQMRQRIAFMKDGEEIHVKGRWQRDFAYHYARRLGTRISVHRERSFRTMPGIGRVGGAER